jgi:hypothetical protein
MSKLGADHFVTIVNERENDVFISSEVFEEFIIGVNGKTIYSLEFLGFGYGGIYLGNTTDLLLMPKKSQSCYIYSEYIPTGEAFSKIELCEQFTMIYKTFSVKDENGEELLNLQTLKPENFREDKLVIQ